MATMAIETSPRMKAAVRRRWGRPRDVVEVAEVAKPAPADDEVLVRVRASSVNRSDYYALGGVAVLMRPMIGGFLRPKDEHVGGDFAGVAEAVGKDVDDVTAGRRGLRRSLGRLRRVRLGEDGRVPEARQSLLRGSGGGAGRRLYRTRSGARSRESPAGPACPRQRRLGRRGQLRRPACEGTRRRARDRGLQRAERRTGRGARRGHVIDYTREDYTRGDERYDLIVDVAGTHSWRQNLRVLVPGGTLVLAGMPSGNHLTGPLGRLARLWLTSRIGRGRKLVFFICKPSRANLAALRELIEDGKGAPNGRPRLSPGRGRRRARRDGRGTHAGQARRPDRLTADHTDAATRSASGISNTNVAPWPGSESTQILPSIERTSSRQM